ncbi:MAG: hypothetical protein ACR2QH_08300, partial [Geminicoccaceae bacterium]
HAKRSEIAEKRYAFRLAILTFWLLQLLYLSTFSVYLGRLAAILIAADFAFVPLKTSRQP